MFTTLTLAMTLTGAVAVESPALKADASRPALIQVARNAPRRFGTGNISSGNSGGRERRLGSRFDNGGRGIFGANLATPPGGFANSKGSNRGNTNFANGKGSNGNAGFANGVGSNGGNAGFANGVGSNAPTGYKTGVPAQSGPAAGAPQGYSTGQAAKGYPTGQGNQQGNNVQNNQQGNNGQGNQQGHNVQNNQQGGQNQQGPLIQPPAGNGQNGGAVNNGQQILDQFNDLKNNKS